MAAERARPVVSVSDDRWTGLWPDGESPVEVVTWDMSAPLPPRAPSLVVLPYENGGEVAVRLGEVPGLEVVQTLTAGYETVLPHLPVGVALANARGVHDASTAELTLGLVLASLRGIDQFAVEALQGVWHYRRRPALADRRVLVVGVGGLGSAIAARLQPFEVWLTRAASRARVDAHGPVHGVDELATLLPHQDVVILACPLTEATRGLVDAAFLAAMPDGALLVNVARGPVVVTAALLTEVISGRLTAALDVTDPEPLPPDHPLWRTAGVLVSPHVGGNSTAFEPRARALLRDQLTRYAAGEPLRNVVRPGRS
jgi:phosphoglycerate dehydrogenase-like enzyme